MKPGHRTQTPTPAMRVASHSVVCLSQYFNSCTFGGAAEESIYFLLCDVILWAMSITFYSISDYHLRLPGYENVRLTNLESQGIKTF